MKVVASFTTLPSRYHILRESMLSIYNQDYPIDSIYLALPKICKRLNTAYPELPDDIASMCTVVTPDVDYGPITKIYGAVISEDDPDTCILSCDDDVVYPKNLVTVLMQHHNTYPNAVISGTGALIGKGLPFVSVVSSINKFRNWNSITGFNVGQGRNVDIIFGVAGVLYTRKCFPHNLDDLLKYTEHSAVFHNDDILISGYLNKCGISRMVFYDIPDVQCLGSPDALSINLVGTITKFQTAIHILQDYGFFEQMEPVSIDESVLGRGIILVIFIILLILCMISFYT